MTLPSVDSQTRTSLIDGLKLNPVPYDVTEDDPGYWLGFEQGTDAAGGDFFMVPGNVTSTAQVLLSDINILR